MFLVLCSQTEFAKLFPIVSITLKCPGGHSSNVRDRTLLMWDPRFRCTPEHSIHIRTPRLRLAHSGAKEKIRIINTNLR